VSAATDRINALVPRVLHLIVGVMVVAAGYYWLLQPRIDGYRKLRAEAQTLDARVRVLEDAIARGRNMTWPDRAQALDLFERRVSKEDRVAATVERLVKAVTESAADGKLGDLAISTGDQAAADTSGQERPASTGEAETIDPRWSLFPYSVAHTAIRMSFEASYETIATFFSKIRDLPTAIEIRSVKLTRGLPLMRAELTVFVFRRSDRQPDAGAVASFQPTLRTPRLSEPASPAGSPVVPRIIEPRAPGGDAP
jgi:Tfp pilus assembly protein PilO